MYFIGQVPTGQNGLLILMLGLGGFFVNASYGVIIGYLSLRYPKEVTGRAIGSTGFIGQFGSFLSPMIAGYLVITMPNGSCDFGNVFLFWAIAGTITYVAAFFLVETPVDAAKYEIKVEKTQTSG